MQGLPLNGASSTVGMYAVVMLALGLLISWAAPACNNPIFAEIVPPDLRNMIYAFDRSFEGAIAACGAPIVGWLAEYMGFKVLSCDFLRVHLRCACSGLHQDLSTSPGRRSLPHAPVEMAVKRACLPRETGAGRGDHYLCNGCCIPG